MRFEKLGANYQKITVKSGEDSFSVFCTQDSLEHRRDEVLLWADKLARRLHWRQYETTVSPASSREATERVHSLFEHRFPDKP